MDDETRIRKEWFPEHIADLEKRDIVEVLHWRKPGTCIYQVEYLIYGTALFVCGDIGDAVYRWSGLITFPWLAKLDLQYFAEKCQASEHGRGYKSFQPHVLKKSVEEMFDYFVEEAVVDGTIAETEKQAKKKELELKFAGLDGPSAMHFSEEWSRWLGEHGHEMFGDDWMEWGLDGMGVDIRCHGHLLGIKMAMAQLEKRKGENPNGC